MKKLLPPQLKSSHREGSAMQQHGAALIIVLAFIVLLLVLLMAFFSRATLQQQISKSSESTTLADVFAEGATESIIGDLRQEIVAGSSVSTIVTTGSSVTVTNTLYYPITNTTFEPAISGFTTNADILNLVKESSSNNFYPNNAQIYLNNIGTNQLVNRATTDSTTNVSLNSRFVSPSRWNEPLFLALSTGTNATSPTTPTTGFTPPTWVLVARDGSNPTNSTFNSNMQWSPTNPTTVVGRYAYTIYNEGGCLDANVAGYPTNPADSGAGLTASNTAYSTAEAFATLSEIGMTTNQIAALVAWRNFASSQAPGTYPSGTYPNYTFSKAINYPTMVWGNTNGFMRIATNVTAGGLTDRMFTSRQQLISFMEGADPAHVGIAMAVMQNLSTHTRDLNQPSYAPPPNRPFVLAPQYGGNSAYINAPGVADNLINPSFLSIRVTNNFTRNDGTIAQVGEPLVKKRFALNRIAWLTYKGPSASLSTNDVEMKALMSNGISADFLTNPVTGGTAANIKKYFGLTYNGGIWTYNFHNGTNAGTGPIMTLPAIAASKNAIHDPDFFEMLKASIAVGSLGKSAVTTNNSVAAGVGSQATETAVPLSYTAPQVPANYRYGSDSSVDYHILQIGANIINQFHADSFPRRIAFNDGSIRGSVTNSGVTDLPYLAYIYNGVVDVTGGLAGQTYIVQVPVVWNPYDPNGVRAPTSLAPTTFRINVQTIDPFHLYATSPKNTWSAALGQDSTNNIYVSYSVNPPIPLTINAINDSIQFTSTFINAYREPTWLAHTSTPNGLSVTRVGVGNSIAAANLTESYPGTTNSTNAIYGDSNSNINYFAPLVLGGPIPLVFTTISGKTTNNIKTTYALMGGGNITADNRIYLTYSVQYLDPVSGSYIPYDIKYGRVSNGRTPVYSVNNHSYTPSIGTGPDTEMTWCWGGAIDPRSARFGLFSDGLIFNQAGFEVVTAPGLSVSGNAATWIDPTNNISTSLRPDQSGGHYLFNGDAFDPINMYSSLDSVNQSYFSQEEPHMDIPFPSNSVGWSTIKSIFNGDFQVDNQSIPGQLIPSFSFGGYAQNNPNAVFTAGRFVPETRVFTFLTYKVDSQSAYYADADGVVRRAADAYMGSVTNSVPYMASNPIGQPEAACVYSNAFNTNSLTNPSVAVIYGLPISSNQIVPYTQSPFNQAQSRPLFLHRPFRSVAELGYVFRDLPWKNIDFSTPESGDKALLDTFCINDTSDPNNLVAGRVDLNTRKTNVISALIMGAYIDDPKVTNTTVGTISRNLSTNIAIALNNYTSTNPVSGVANNGPLTSLGDLVGHYVTNASLPAGVLGGLTGTNYSDGKFSYSGFSGSWPTNPNGYAGLPTNTLSTAYYYALSTNTPYFLSMLNIQRLREAPIRSLSSAGQTRVWNLMIDVIAQTGRYPGSASKLQNFMVEGEQRYWVHLSIDRLTGQVIDKQIEPVKE